MKVTAHEAAEAVGGRVHGPDVPFEGASTDSRTIAPGQLFVPVVAARDGHDFIATARDAGAAAYLTSRAPSGGTAIEVDDTARALWDLGRYARTRLPDAVVGITGSVGKTTVKDLAAGGLAAGLRTHATRASFNNELGVPLTLLAGPAGVEIVVLEMGARFPGDIARLCELARPTIGVITSIGSAHLEHLGGPAGVRAEKGSLLVDLPAQGFAVVNDVDCGADVRARTSATVVTFGTTTGDVRAAVVALDDELCPTVRVDSPWGTGTVTLSVRGDHQAANAAAALATAVCAGVDFDAALTGVAGAEGSSLRAELWRTPTGLRVLNDTYNANPTSTGAALRSLAQLEAPRRVAVLGEMAELGADTVAAHQEIGRLAHSLGIEVVAVGGAPYGGVAVASQDEALVLVEDLPADSVVLLKASRSVGLDRLAEHLRGGVGAR